MDNELWEMKRRKLEGEVIEAALALISHTSAAAMSIPIPNTTPQIVLLLGEVSAVKDLLDSQYTD